MKYKFTIILFFNIIFLATNNAETLINGSIESGKTKSTTCAACHGADGNSINPIWPSIAGQHATYAAKQLKAYKNGVRIDPLMTSMTTMLSDQDIADLAVYYENLTAKQNSINDDSSIIKGEKIYRGGNINSGVSACIACHGPQGKGNPAALYPSVNSQFAMYTAKQLRDYASGLRKTDEPTQIMRDIASRLTEEEILSVSLYIQGLY
jgi:cytochrome c553